MRAALFVVGLDLRLDLPVILTAGDEFFRSIRSRRPGKYPFLQCFT